MSKEPDGYALWRNGFVRHRVFKHLHQAEAALKLTSRKGWQIKPVWLSTEPPVSKEILGKLKTYLLKHSKASHYYCDDSWYTCPLHPEGCANEAEKDCTCGAEARAQEAVDLLVELNLPPEQDHE